MFSLSLNIKINRFYLLSLTAVEVTKAVKYAEKHNYNPFIQVFHMIYKDEVITIILFVVEKLTFSDVLTHICSARLLSLMCKNVESSTQFHAKHHGF